MTTIFERSMTGLRTVLAAGAFVAGLGSGAMAAEESAHGEATPPEIPADAVFTDFDASVFKPNPTYEDEPYDAQAQVDIYGGKTAIEDAPRPLLEIGAPFYQVGYLGDDYALLGERNLMRPGFRVYGDWRTAVAYNDNGGVEQGLVATRLNLDMDLQLTATERIHAFIRPLDQDNKFTRYVFAANGGDHGFTNEFNGNLQNFFFEGDLGSIYSGLSGRYQDFDLPFAVGFVPLLFQNGIWVDDAFVGGAFAIPARNSPELDITNFDVTFFGGFDKVTTPAIRDNLGGLADEDLDIFGIATFIEANEGYWEAGYGTIIGEHLLEDQGYDSATLAFSKRYGGWLSNSVRGFWTFGQDPAGGAPQTADGFALLVENSLVTSLPSTLVPYFNAFVGFDRPQPLARTNGSLLTNTGINFATDNLTGFPKLDDTANNTYGGALGVEYLFNLDRQLVLEVAGLRAFDSDVGRNAAGDQAAVGVRYQQPISLAWIVQADAMYGWLENVDDIGGIRFELRRKF